MENRKCAKKIVFWVIFCLAAGGIASWLTLDGLRSFSEVNQPPLTPPMLLFPIVWSILLVLMGISFGGIRCRKAWAEPAVYDAAVTAFAVQLTFFFCWMLWFFGLGWYGFSALWTVGLIVSIAVMIRKYHAIAPLYAWLQVPYLLWCCFALYLNVGAWWLNR